jgi:glycosyltransferase involved in cell wall biosynthesis
MIHFYPYYPKVGSTRFRVLAYLPYLLTNGICSEVYFPSLPSRWGLANIAKPKVFSSLAWHINQFLQVDNNCRLLSRLYEAAFVWPRCGEIAFIQKPLYPGTNSILEEIIRKRYSKMIFDLDDALFVNPMDGYKNLKRREKIERIISMADRVILGNIFLYDELIKTNKDVRIIPTPVKMLRKRAKDTNEDTIVIGWIGQASNYVNLNLIEGALKVIVEENKNVIIRIIGGPSVYDSKLIQSNRFESRLWNENSEDDDLRSFDIGIMPLIDNMWNRGKCAYKLLQYMSAGIPSIASPVGMNKDVITDWKEGVFANTTGDWIDALRLLINGNLLA